MQCRFSRLAACFTSRLTTRSRQRSVLLSFEGIDGCGKSTQARLLSQWLREQGHDVVEIREPGGTPLGEIIRGLLLDSMADLSAPAELFLFAAARAQLVDQVIRPALKSGAIVVADRFTDSTLAYQGGGRSVAPDAALEAINRIATGDVEPSLTFWLDLPLDVARSRRDGLGAPDRMERAGDDFYRRVDQAYRKLAESSPDRVLRIDAAQDVDLIQRGLQAAVQARLDM